MKDALGHGSDSGREPAMPDRVGPIADRVSSIADGPAHSLGIVTALGTTSPLGTVVKDEASPLGESSPIGERSPLGDNRSAIFDRITSDGFY